MLQVPTRTRDASEKVSDKLSPSLVDRLLEYQRTGMRIVPVIDIRGTLGAEVRGRLSPFFEVAAPLAQLVSNGPVLLLSGESPAAAETFLRQLQKMASTSFDGLFILPGGGAFLGIVRDSTVAWRALVPGVTREEILEVESACKSLIESPALTAELCFGPQNNPIPRLEHHCLQADGAPPFPFLRYYPGGAISEANKSEFDAHFRAHMVRCAALLQAELKNRQLSRLFCIASGRTGIYIGPTCKGRALSQLRNLAEFSDSAFVCLGDEFIPSGGDESLLEHASVAIQVGKDSTLTHDNLLTVRGPAWDQVPQILGVLTMLTQHHSGPLVVPSAREYLSTETR